MTHVKREIFERKARESARPIESTIFIEQTVGEAISHIRSIRCMDDTALYFYVISDNGKLVGVVNIRDLLQTDPEALISSITNTKVKTIPGSLTTLEGLHLMRKYHLLAMPVVENGTLIGVLNVQDYFDETLKLSNTKKRIEIFQSLGFILDEEPNRSTWHKYKTRVPWILCNMIGGIACAVIADFYEMVLLRVIVLAMFIPLVLTLSESISMQSMTQSLYQTSKNKMGVKESIFYIIHESKLFILIAMTCGAIVGFLSLLWGDGWMPAVTIGSGITISVVISAVIGALVPLVLHSFKLDPTIASGPVVLMFADVVTTTIYLSLAFWLLLT